MKLNLKKVPMLKSALFLLLAYSLYSCNLEPHQPEDKRERNFKYRQQVLNQERNDGITSDDGIQSPPEPPTKEPLFQEIVDPRFSQKTLKLSEEEAQQLHLLSFQNSEPLSEEETPNEILALKEPASEKPLDDDSAENPPAPENKLEEDPAEIPESPASSNTPIPEESDDGTVEEPLKENSSGEETIPTTAETPSTTPSAGSEENSENQQPQEGDEQPDPDSSNTNENNPNEQNPSTDSDDDSSDDPEEQPKTTTSKKPQPPATWDISTIDLDS